MNSKYDITISRCVKSTFNNSDFVTPALRQAQDKLTFGQAGVQLIELGFAGMGGFLPNSQNTGFRPTPE